MVKLKTYLLLGILSLPFWAVGQCVSDISGTGIGAGVACTAPNSYSYTNATYSSTVTGTGWTYTWTTSPNGSINYGQGTSSISVTWNSAPTGICSSWVNLVVSDGQGCTYNYAVANGVNGKCVNVQARPSPNHSGNGMPFAYNWACLYDPDLNNAESYSATSPCTGCNYFWSISGGTIVSGQGTANISVRWLQQSGTTLDLSVSSPNGCSSNWWQQEGSSQSIQITVSNGYPTYSVTGPSTAYANGCAFRYVGSRNTGVMGGNSTWLAPGGTIVRIGAGLPPLYGTAYDTVDVIWNSTGLKRVTLVNYALGLQCATGSGMNVNVLAGTFTQPSIQGNSQPCIDGNFNYQTVASTGTNYTWTVQNGTLLSGQGTGSVQVDWANTGVGSIIVQAVSGLCSFRDTLNVVVTAPTPFSLGQDTIICGSSFPLAGPPNQSGYLWSTGANSPFINAPIGGDYWLEVMAPSGCLTRDSISILIHPIPNVSLGPDTVACLDSIYITALGNFSAYSWTTGNTVPAIWIDSTGLYAVEVADTNGCIDDDSIFVTLANAASINLGNDTLVCQDSLQIQAPTGFLTYGWTTSESTPSVWVDTSGAYGLEVMDTNGCVAFDTIQIMIAGVKSIDLGLDIFSCQLPVSVLGPVGQETYLWSMGDTTQNMTANAWGNVWLTVVDSNGCSASDTLAIQSFPALSQVFFGNDTILCQPSLVLHVPPFGQSYLWSDGSLADSIQVITAGSYWVQIVDSNGCSISDTIQVNAAMPPIGISLPCPIELCDGQSVMAFGPSGYMAYLWNGINTGSSYLVNQAGSIVLTVIDSNGCVGVSPPCQVTLHPLPTPTISVSGDTLFASPPGTYNWHLNGQSTGQTASWFVPTISGTYTVEVTDSFGCFAVSQPHVFVGIEANAITKLHIWPNPSNGRFCINLPSTIVAMEIRVEMLDFAGKRITIETEIETDKVLVNSQNLASGLYLMQVSAGDAVHTCKVVIVDE